MTHDCSHQGSALRNLLLTVSVVIALAGGWWAWENATRESKRAEETRLPAPPPSLLVAKANAPAPMPPPATYQSTDDQVRVGVPSGPIAAGIFMIHDGTQPNPQETSIARSNQSISVEVFTDSVLAAVHRGELAGGLVPIEELVLHAQEIDVVIAGFAGWQRGMTQWIVRENIHDLRDLLGRVVAVPPFSQADLFLRRLAALTETPIRELSPDRWQEQVEVGSLNIVPARDDHAAGQWFLKAIVDGDDRVAGCVTRFPTSEWLLSAAPHKTRRLVSDRNFPINAFYLVFNRGFADSNPTAARALTQRLFEGNALASASPEKTAQALADRLRWKSGTAATALGLVQLADTNDSHRWMADRMRALFSQVAALYGILQQPEISLLPDVEPSDKSEPLFAPRRLHHKQLPLDPLWQDTFPLRVGPNVATIDSRLPENTALLDKIQTLISASAGSVVRLRVYTDNGLLPQKEPDQALAMHAMDLSRARGETLRRELVSMGIPAESIEIEAGGWAPDGQSGPSVEVAWFILE